MSSMACSSNAVFSSSGTVKGSMRYGVTTWSSCTGSGASFTGSFVSTEDPFAISIASAVTRRTSAGRMSQLAAKPQAPPYSTRTP